MITIFFIFSYLFFLLLLFFQVIFMLTGCLQAAFSVRSIVWFALWLDVCICLILWTDIFQHPQIQKESQYIKYLCCDDRATLHQWVTGIRIAKVRLKVYLLKYIFCEILCPQLTDCYHLNWRYCDKSGRVCSCWSYHRRKEQKGITSMVLLNVPVSQLSVCEFRSYKIPTHKTHSIYLVYNAMDQVVHVLFSPAVMYFRHFYPNWWPPSLLKDPNPRPVLFCTKHLGNGFIHSPV